MSQNERQVLEVFGILAPERIQKLVDLELSGEIELKQAAGAEGFTPNMIASKAKPIQRAESNILNFPTKKARDFEPMRPDEGAQGEEKLEGMSSSDFMIWQNEMSKRNQELSRKPHESYQKSKQVYIVRSLDEQGKAKTKLAKTQGVLLDKKSS